MALLNNDDINNLAANIADFIPEGAQGRNTAIALIDHIRDLNRELVELRTPIANEQVEFYYKMAEDSGEGIGPDPLKRLIVHIRQLTRDLEAARADLTTANTFNLGQANVIAELQEKDRIAAHDLAEAKAAIEILVQYEPKLKLAQAENERLTEALRSAKEICELTLSPEARMRTKVDKARDWLDKYEALAAKAV